MFRRPRNYLALVLIIFIIFIFYDLGTQYYWWQAGRSMAQRTAPLAYQQHVPGGGQRVLFIGDSTVVGTGAILPSDSIAGRFGRDCSNLEVVNLGKNGDRIARLDERLEPGSVGKFDLVVVQIGGNDVVHNTPLPEIAVAMDNVLKKLKTISPEVVLIPSVNDLGKVPFFPWFLEGVMSNRSEAVRNIMSAVAQENNVVLIDLYNTPAQQLIFIDPKKYFAVDRFHPNTAGYSLLYGQLKNELLTKDIIKTVGSPFDKHCRVR